MIAVRGHPARTIRARPVSYGPIPRQRRTARTLSSVNFPTRMFGAVFVFAASASASAQDRASTTIVVRGITRDAESGAPVEGVRVEVGVAARVVISREAGRFDVRLPAPGSYTIRATRLGYQPVTVESLLTGRSDSTELVIVMTRASVSLAAVVVTPGTFGIMQTGVAASQSFARDQIEAAPQIGEDIYRAVNRLPGIATDDFTSDFRVRGGAGSELYSTLDGVELVRPFHLQDIGGSFSIIDVKSIGAVDLTMGGLTADIGNRLTGAFAMRTIEPVSSGVQGSVGMSLMNARAQAQGGFADGRGGWLASYRRGYLDIALKLAGAGDSLHAALRRCALQGALRPAGDLVRVGTSDGACAARGRQPELRGQERRHHESLCQ